MNSTPLISKVALILAGWGLLTPIFSGYFNGIFLLGWLIWAFFREKNVIPPASERAVSYIARPMEIGIILVVCSHILSAIGGYFWSPFAPSLGKVLSPIQHLLLKWGLLWVVYFNSMRLMVRKNWDPSKVGSWLLVAMVVHFLYCMVQRSTGIDWTHGFSGHLESNRFAYGVYRISGWHSHPLTLAYNLMLISASAAYIAIMMGDGLSFSLRVCWGAVSCFALLTLLFTGSRFVLLVFPVTLFLLEWRRIRAYVWQISSFLLVAGVVLWWEGSFKGRFAELFDPSIPFSVRWSRVVYWQVHWRVFLDHPWFGVTMGGMRDALKQYWPAEYSNLEILPAHNIFLQTLADSGVIGAFGLVGFLISFWISSRRAYRVLGRSSGLEWMLTLTIIVGLVQNNLRDSEYLMALWYLSSVLIVRAALVSLGRGDDSVKIKKHLSIPHFDSIHDGQSNKNR